MNKAMDNAMVAGIILIGVGLLFGIAGFLIPMRALMEPCLWLVAGGTTISAASPLIGLIVWLTRRFLAR